MTNIARSPDQLSDAINKYTDHESQLYVGRGDKFPLNVMFDVFHFHNKVFNFNNAKVKVIQFRSEPFRVDINAKVNQKFVLAQYHATLPQYSNATVVRNLVDFLSPPYEFKEVTDKIRIGYSPSITKKVGRWYDKGYQETTKIFNQLKQRFPNIEIDIMTRVQNHEVIKRKANCNIIIDECVTGSYHKSGLEGLGLGKLTICGMNVDVEKVMKKAAHTDTQPFTRIGIGNLFGELSKIIEKGIPYINEVGFKNRQWMEKFWTPESIANEFIDHYKKLLENG